MKLTFTTVDELITALNALPASVRSQPTLAWGGGCGLTITGLELTDEDYIDPLGEGAIPISQYEGLQQDCEIVVPKGTVMFMVDNVRCQCPQCQEWNQITTG